MPITVSLPPHNLKFTAAFPKAGIAQYCALRGKANSTPLLLGSTSHKPLSLRFEEFAGTLGEGGLYRGDYLFMTGDFSGADSADLNDLPGLVAPKSAKKGNSDVLQP